MAKLSELAQLIRSKNAGPFQLTFDIMFQDRATYERVLGSGVLTVELFSRLYNTLPADVDLIPYSAGLAIKVTIPRPVFEGDLHDTDIYGGQQYGPLVDLEIP